MKQVHAKSRMRCGVVWSWVWGCLGAMAVIATGSVGAAQTLTSDDAARASAVLGLELNVRELEQLLPGLNENLQSLVELRKRRFPNELGSALVFDPRPPGFLMPEVGRGWKWTAPTKVRLPEKREDLAFMTVAELSVLLRAGKVSSETLTQLALERLKQHGPKLHCVVGLTEERGLAEARRADAEIKSGKWRGPLHGIPYAVKDLFDVRGTPTTCGVSLLTNNLATEDATVVRKLGEAGAVLVAKLSLGELAMGDVWFGGLTRNPWHPEKGSSGSSAGSASAVAAGLVPFAMGSETLGSIVSPSTICGVTGLRPTFGRVSRHGAMTLSPTMDKLGPLARSAEDAGLVLEAIRGSDQKDRAVVDVSMTGFQGERIRKLRVGYLVKDFEKKYENREPDAAALELLRKAGYELKPVELPVFPKGALYMILGAEAAASFDELTRSNEDERLVQQEAWSWPNQFRTSRFISAVDYLQANRVRLEVMMAMARIFQEVDVLVAPSFRGNQLLYSNLSGHPCVVVPNGDLRGENRPSLCFLAGLYRESDAVGLADVYQRSTAWHRQRP